VANVGANSDLDNNDGGNQITVYTGRGMLVDNSAGPIWLWGTAVERKHFFTLTSLLIPFLFPV